MLKLFGDANERALKRLQPLLLRINELEPSVQKLSDAELTGKTPELRKRLEEGETLDDLLAEAFALVREAAWRTLQKRHFDVQLIGGMVLHQGKITEMRTGEGKTLAATAPAYLNALAGKGVHVVTVNDYLAKRDTAWMGQVYAALGMTVGCVTQEGSYKYKNPKSEIQNPKDDEERDTKGSFMVADEFLESVSKKEAYACDITYGTNNEYGFDYLRDNMELSLDRLAQREHFFAIVDEVDSILIDESRTPLIISAPDVEAPHHYDQFSRIAPRLKENEDYNVDEKRRAVLVTEEGVRKVEEILGMENLYEEGLRLVHYLEQSLRAQVLYKRDRDYVLKDGEIIIVDEFTGRLMPGRRWSEGLHQAVEAKEGVKVQAESRTLATITFQNYFRMYEKLSGMTGTAQTSAEEFFKVYELEVLTIPTARPMVRQDQPDFVFRSEAGKWQALIRGVRERHERGQPVLIGTTSISKNELVSSLLSKDGIPHEVLNAKNHEREGSIIAQAGRKGVVTVATNMAGRGVDIILGGNPPDATEANAVCAIGGLAVLGTERHEARRIDDQLRGRSGRQGDPGESQFFLSLEDDLLRVFGGDRLKSLMDRLDVPEDQPIESGLVSRAVASAQGRIEGHNFDIRKHLLEYDDVANRHREAVYRRRRRILEGKDVEEELTALFVEEVTMLASVHLGSEYPNEWSVEEFVENLKALMPTSESAHAELLAIAERGELQHAEGEEGGVTMRQINDADERRGVIVEMAEGFYQKALEKRKSDLGEDTYKMLQQQVLLRSIDTLWVEHLEMLDALRDAVRLRAYGQRDPLVEYKTEARRSFKELEASIRSRSIQMLFRAEIHTHAPGGQHQHGEARKPGVQTNAPQQGGSQASAKKAHTVGRNDPCPCGSGKKYKKCGMVNAPEHRG